jgi:hypothetical protein
MLIIWRTKWLLKLKMGMASIKSIGEIENIGKDLKQSRPE